MQLRVTSVPAWSKDAKRLEACQKLVGQVYTIVEQGLAADGSTLFTIRDNEQWASVNAENAEILRASAEVLTSLSSPVQLELFGGLT